MRLASRASIGADEAAAVSERQSKGNAKKDRNTGRTPVDTPNAAVASGTGEGYAAMENVSICLAGMALPLPWPASPHHPLLLLSTDQESGDASTDRGETEHRAAAVMAHRQLLSL
jgi:hypothetical protein